MKKDIFVIFVGSNPSQSAYSYAAFCDSTNSGRTLSNWIWKLELSMEIEYYNLANKPTPKNRPLRAAEIKAAIPALENHIEWIHYQHKYKTIKLVGVGKTAQKALTLLGVPHFQMPHPSGLNRQLNDTEFIEGKIKGLREYLNPSSVSVNVPD